MSTTESVPPLEPVTAAVMSGDVLVVATVGPDRHGRMRLIKARSGEVTLVDRSQLSLRLFTRELGEFLHKRSITHLMFICSPSAGDHMAGVSSYKVEALIQLITPSVELMHSSAVTSFRNRAPQGVPGPDKERLTRHLAQMQARAILAAVYQFHKAEELERQVKRQDEIEQRRLEREAKRRHEDEQRNLQRHAQRQRELARCFVERKTQKRRDVEQCGLDRAAQIRSEAEQLEFDRRYCAAQEQIEEERNQAFATDSARGAAGDTIAAPELSERSVDDNTELHDSTGTKMPSSPGPRSNGEGRAMTMEALVMGLYKL